MSRRTVRALTPSRSVSSRSDHCRRVASRESSRNARREVSAIRPSWPVVAARCPLLVPSSPGEVTEQPVRSRNTMRVVVVGGGIGGLALGAGLRSRGIEVAVFDRDTDVTATAGYHITVDGRAQSALRDLVAPRIFERLQASASALRLRDRDALWDRRGR